MLLKRHISLLSISLLVFSFFTNAQTSTDTKTGIEAYQKKDFSTSLAYFVKAANAGDKDAMMMVAAQYAKGEGVTKDSVNYVLWLTRAAKAGNDKAMYNLGFMYDNGRYLSKDSAKALLWYTVGAEAGNTDCENNLGVKYSKGRWVTKDYAMAMQLLTKAAEAGNAFAMVNLAEMYEYGRGIPQSYSTAYDWYKKAYNKDGSPNGAYHIAIFYEEGKAGLPKDERAAMEWYQKANRSGTHTGAIQHIGQLYQFGLGVTADTAEAIRWYTRAATNGNGFGLYYLGRMEKDYLRASKLFQAADRAFVDQINRTLNDTESMRGMAVLYENGYGVPKNLSIAITLYRKAADWGDERAKSWLAAKKLSLQ